MGYRSNFVIVNKDKINKLMAFKSLKEAHDCFCPDMEVDDAWDMQSNIENVLFKDCRKYEIGKYYESTKVLEGYSEVALLATEDTECVLGDADMIKRAILQEQQNIITYLGEFITQFDEQRIKVYLESKKLWSSEQYLTNLDKDDFHATNSWHREYEIFSLVALYKSIKDEEAVVYTAG